MDKIAVIPARSGSKRMPQKNYRLFNSRNLVEIARDKCLEADIFDKIIISSDDPVFEGLVNCKQVEFLMRGSYLADDHATTDLVIDFFFEEENNVWLVNEVNTMPGFTPISMFPKLWSYSGISYKNLIERLITDLIRTNSL